MVFAYEKPMIQSNPKFKHIFELKRVTDLRIILSMIILKLVRGDTILDVPLSVNNQGRIFSSRWLYLTFWGGWA